VAVQNAEIVLFSLPRSSAPHSAGLGGLGAGRRCEPVLLAANGVFGVALQATSVKSLARAPSSVSWWRPDGGPRVRCWRTSDAGPQPADGGGSSYPEALAEAAGPAARVPVPVPAAEL